MLADRVRILTRVLREGWCETQSGAGGILGSSGAVWLWVGGWVGDAHLNIQTVAFVCAPWKMSRSTYPIPSRPSSFYKIQTLCAPLHHYKSTPLIPRSLRGKLTVRSKRDAFFVATKAPSRWKHYHLCPTTYHRLLYIKPYLPCVSGFENSPQSTFYFLYKYIYTFCFFPVYLFLFWREFLYFNYYVFRFIISRYNYSADFKLQTFPKKVQKKTAN